jgi:DNA-binding NtrC family response regulator
MAHRWPGNVRELENTMHRAVLLAVGDEIGAEAIQTPDGRRQGGVPAAPAASVLAVAANAVGQGPAAGLVGRTVADVERDLIIDTLYHCLGNRTHAATILGISIRTLRNKLNLYTAEGLRVPMPGESRSLAVG